MKNIALLALLAFLFWFGFRQYISQLGTEPNREQQGISLAEPLTAESATQEQASQVKAVGEPSQRTKRSLAASPSDEARVGQMKVVLQSMSQSDPLSTPWLEVHDSEFGAPTSVEPNDSFWLPKEPRRMVQVMHKTPGWELSEPELQVDSTRPDSLELLATPKFMLALKVVDRETGAPIESPIVRAVWEDQDKTQGESPSTERQAPSGELLVEGFPLDRGRYRVEVSTLNHFVSRSAWFDCEANEVPWVQMELLSKQSHLTPVRVALVEESSSTPLEGLQVQLFEESDVAPITGLQVGHQGMTALRAYTEDVGFLRMIPMQVSDEQGFASFEVPAPGRYRIATGSETHPVVLGQVIEVRPGLSEEVEVLLQQPGSVRGQIHASSKPNDIPLSTIRNAWLHGEKIVLSTEVAYDGSFGFPAVAPGPYTLSIEKILSFGEGQQISSPVQSRAFTLKPGQEIVEEFSLEQIGSSGTVAGSLQRVGSPKAHLVAIFPTPQAGVPDAGSDAHMVTAADEDGSFAFQNVPAGQWSLVAVGLSEDGAEVSLQWGSVELTNQGQEPAHLNLSVEGEPLVLLGESGELSRQAIASVGITGVEATVARIVADLPPIKVQSGAPARVLGIPSGQLTVHCEGRSIPVDPSRIVAIALD